jgi:hypothetical protein
LMVHVTPESVHQVHVLDLPACRTEDRRHGLLLGQVRCGGEASFPPSRAPCAKDRALTHSTPRRHPVVGLRPSPPEPDAEAVNHDMQCTLDPARSRDGRAVLLGVPPAPVRGDRGRERGQAPARHRRTAGPYHLPGPGAGRVPPLHRDVLGPQMGRASTREAPLVWSCPPSPTRRAVRSPRTGAPRWLSSVP